jgi:SIR2-like domain
MSNRLLLTGAGFSANFGAPLARDISDLFFNDDKIKKNQNLQELIAEIFDYEELYYTVMHEDRFSNDDKAEINDSLSRAYIHLDKCISRNQFTLKLGGNIFRELFLYFSKRREGSGLMFTLNQDLLIEKLSYHYPDPELQIELPVAGSNFLKRGVQQSFHQDEMRALPAGDKYLKRKSDFERKIEKGKLPLSYIKLHGSMEWYQDVNDQKIMVIGRDKEEQIKRAPLLNWYLELFKNALKEEDTRLLIIGYSFTDHHINKIICNSNQNLKLWILDTMPREQFVENLDNKPYGNNIKEMISGYYSRRLVELFPNTGQLPHPDKDNLISSFFKND